MDISTLLTNDQVAILGCFVAIAVCGLIAALSFRLGPVGQQQASKTSTIPLNAARKAETAASQERRAA